MNWKTAFCKCWFFVIEEQGNGFAQTTDLDGPVVCMT